MYFLPSAYTYKSSLILSDYWLFCFIFMQVIDLGGEPITSGQYTHLGRVTEFKYGAKLGTIFRKWNGEKLSYTRYESFSYHVEKAVRLFICNCMSATVFNIFM